MIDAEPSFVAAEGIRGSALLAYLVAKGWTARPSRVRGMSVVSKHVSDSAQIVEILLPVVPGFADEQRRVADALRSLGAAEGRSEFKVAQDIRLFERIQNEDAAKDAERVHERKRSKKKEEAGNQRLPLAPPGPSQEITGPDERAIQARGGVVAYLTVALDDVAAVSPTAVHLLEMAIAILSEEVPGETPEKINQTRPS
jgi:hypothetical protein